MKLLLFACTIWCSAYIHPSDVAGQGITWIHTDEMINNQVDYHKVYCNTTGCGNLQTIIVTYDTGNVLVAGKNSLRTSINFCTGYNDSYPLYCTFNGGTIDKAYFFLRVNCYHGCKNVKVAMDGDVKRVILAESDGAKYETWDLDPMDKGERFYYKIECDTIGCGNLSTIKITNDGDVNVVGKTLLPHWPGIINFCKVGENYYPKYCTFINGLTINKASFYLEVYCPEPTGCRKIKAIMDGDTNFAFHTTRPETGYTTFNLIDTMDKSQKDYYRVDCKTTGCGGLKTIIITSDTGIVEVTGKRAKQSYGNVNFCKGWNSDKPQHCTFFGGHTITKAYFFLMVYCLKGCTNIQVIMDGDAESVTPTQWP